MKRIVAGRTVKITSWTISGYKTKRNKLQKIYQIVGRVEKKKRL